MMAVEGYGVCRLNVVTVWQEPSFHAPWCTQLLFGDHYQVLGQSADHRFLRIKICADGTEGWIYSLQHHAISAEYFDYLNRAEFKITTDVTSSILYNKSQVVIVMGSIIPISTAELFRMEEHFAFNGEAKNLGQYRDAEYLKNQVMKYVGAPYLPGGKTPFGIDPGALVQMAYRFCGYMLPRFPEQQIKAGKPVIDPTKVCPGDLLFLNQGSKVLQPAILLETHPWRAVLVTDRVNISEIDPAATLAGIRRILASA